MNDIPILASTCRVAIEGLAEFIGLEAAELYVFSKMRPHMREREQNPASQLHRAIVPEMRAAFKTPIENLDDKYLDALAVAKGDLSYENYVNEGGKGEWTPSACRALHWNPEHFVMGDAASKVQMHNMAMAELGDRIRADWLLTHNQGLSEEEVKKYMTGMAAHCSKQGEQENYFNGVP